MESHIRMQRLVGKATRIPVQAALLLVTVVALSACTTTDASIRTARAPEMLPPVASSSVQTASLPPIGPDGQVLPATPTDAAGNMMLVSPPQQAAQPGAPQISLDAVGSIPAAPGRNLSAGVSVDKLLGGWTVIAGTQQCRLNLTQTTKTGTQRYRASTPGCQIPGLAVVASWQLAGTQVQLFDENGDRIGVMQLSGERFIGTLAGGLGVSMVG
jgi:hypothetical protein